MYFENFIVEKLKISHKFHPILVIDYTLCDLNPFKLFEVCFMAYHTVHSGECSRCTWEEYVFCCCWMKSYIDVCQVQLLKFSISLLIFSLVVLCVIESGVLKCSSIVKLSISTFNSASFSFTYFGILLLNAYNIYNC